MKENIPNAINKIQWRREFRVEKDHPAFTITIEEDGKVIYFNKAFAGVLNFIQSVDEFDFDTMEVTGDSQVFGFGHPVIQLFAIDQLIIKMKPIMIVARKILEGLLDEDQLKAFLTKVNPKNSTKGK